MHDRKLENPTSQNCKHFSGRIENPIVSVCVDCGDSEPGWLVRRAQVLEDEVAKLREFTQPENR